MSNFTFLKTDWPELFETARDAKQNLASTLLSQRQTLAVRRIETIKKDQHP